MYQELFAVRFHDIRADYRRANEGHLYGPARPSLYDRLVSLTKH